MGVTGGDVFGLTGLLPLHGKCARDDRDDSLHHVTTGLL